MTDADERKIHVGSLSFDTDDDILKEFFEKEIGPVEEAKVVIDRETGRSRGFGFVTFIDKKHAEEAISKNTESHNSQTLDGRAIRVNKPRGGGRVGGGYRGGGGGGYRGGGGGGGGFGGSGGYASGGYGSGSYGGGGWQ